ncbi:MAG: hypothetical protein GC166_11125 [Alphaproteobacteria bacterium]|nr:hypothetical protein [Alphaproteobacteria bacterium]
MRGLLRLARHTTFCLCDTARLGHDYAFRERFNIAVFISPKRDFLFTKNEKCGNNTARITLQHLVAEKPLPEGFKDSNRWFAPLRQPSDLGLSDIRDINSTIPFKFAVVRNPFSRTLSSYLNKFATRAGKRDRFAQKLGGDANLSFAEFVALVGKQKPLEMDPHWRVQYDNIFCDVIRYDHYVRFENMDAEFAEVLNRIGGKADIRNVRKNEYRAGDKIAQYYTPEIAEQVRAIYARDFAQFGYPLELPV